MRPKGGSHISQDERYIKIKTIKYFNQIDAYAKKYPKQSRLRLATLSIQTR